MRRNPLPIVYSLVVFLSGVLYAHATEPKELAKAVESITQKELKNHAAVLSSDTYEGREGGSRGGRAAAVYLVSKLNRLKSIKPAGDRGSYYQFFGQGYRNVLAYLPGSDEKLKHEFIVVCAHFDHVGYGAPNNSYGPYGYIHNGADDNASGTSGLLEIVEAFDSMNPRPKRSILFAFWDSEEKGLLGSAHWVREPTIPLKQVQIAFNMDMIGRLRKGKVHLHGIRSGYGFRRFLSEQNRDEKLYVDFSWDLPLESDHNTFISSKIPAVMLHTGKHSNYHRPSDDLETLNIAGLQRMTQLGLRLVYGAANAKSLPTFRGKCEQESNQDRQYLTAEPEPLPLRFGVSWNSESAARGRIEVTDVSYNSPAHRGGLMAGDVIARFAKRDVANSSQFRQLVFSAKNPVPVVVLRNGRRVQLNVNLNGQPQRIGISWRFDEAEPGTVFLTRVMSGSPAAAAGLQVRDRIHSIAGRSFRTTADIDKLLDSATDTLAMTIERAAVVRTVTLQLREPSKRTLRPVVAPRPLRR